MNSQRFFRYLLISFIMIFLVIGCAAQDTPTVSLPTVQPDTGELVPVKPTDTTVVGVPETAEMEAKEEAIQPESGVDAILAQLEGLPIDGFFNESYIQLLLRTPQYVTSMGLSGTFGTRDDQMDNLSITYLEETQELESGILELLRQYDRDALDADQQLSYDVYEWYLQNQVDGHQFAFHSYPVNHFINDYHFALDSMFTEDMPMVTRENVEDYISRLWGVKTQVTQLKEGLDLRTEKGIIPPTYVIDMAKSNLYGYFGVRSPDLSRVSAENIDVYSVFSSKLDQVEGLTAEEKEDFRAQAVQAVDESIVPAYVMLLAYLDEVRPLSTEDAGVWKFPEGDAYYEYALHRQTTTGMTPEDIHQLGLAEVERLHGELREAFTEMGYDSGESLRTSMDRAVSDAGFFSTSSELARKTYIETVKQIIADADERVGEVFDMRPRLGLDVVGGPWGGYYSPGNADGSRLGAYHVATEGANNPVYSAYTIAYHEAIPGHHFQIQLSHELEMPLFRNDVHFTGYIEGWALYAERLAWELGLYDENPFGNIGRLQFELLRAARLVLDTGIHNMGWTRAEARKYMDEAMASQPGWFYHEIDRYIVYPAQATTYKIGMIKILELRQRAEDELGTDFDIKEFHNVVIGNGAVPLDILERLVDDFIKDKQDDSS